MFFRKKKRDDDVVKLDDAPKAQSVEGTAPGVVESPATADQSVGSAKMSEETVDASVVAPKGTALTRAHSDDESVRLFPGFEHDDFEVGFRADQELPSLMVRWKDGNGEWFAMPPLFNRGILQAMDERESSNDLNRLLRNYGYDIDAVQD